MRLPSVPIHPGGRPTTIAQADAGSATLEIVPLLAVQGPEKFRVVQAIQLPVDPRRPGHEAGIAAQGEEASAHPARPEERRTPGEHPMARVPAHEGAVSEEERATGLRQPAGPRRGTRARAARPRTARAR